MPRRFTFTETQLSEMERLYLEGYGTATIAAQFGCLMGTVWQLLKKRGVKMRDGRVHSPPKIVRHSNGYLLVGGKYEHRRVMEQKLGRLLAEGEVVHHINGVKDDNRPENLEMMPSNAAHMRDGHPYQTWSVQGDLRLVYLRGVGWSSSAIGQMLGFGVHSVNNRVRRLIRGGVLNRVRSGRKPRSVAYCASPRHR